MTDWMRSTASALLSCVAVAASLLPAASAEAECGPKTARALEPAWSLAAAGDEDGIGGSGVLGTITGFGSICVGDVRIVYGESVAVTQGGAPASASSLAIGQLVWVVASNTSGLTTAQSIAIHYDAVGPLEHSRDGSLEVGGRRIVLLANAIVTIPLEAEGVRVAVSGLRRPDGAVAATRIDPAPEDWDAASAPSLQALASIDVEGYLHDATGGGLHLGKLRIALSGDAALERARPLRGARVRIRAARFADGQLRAVRIDRVREARLMPRIERATAEPHVPDPRERGRHARPDRPDRPDRPHPRDWRPDRDRPGD